MQLHDNRPDDAAGRVTLSETEVAGSQPPDDWYRGPDFSMYGIVISGENVVEVY
jgi:hypothetical protein